jgi:O-antigen/teichoic acid export membrane protein
MTAPAHVEPEQAGGITRRARDGSIAAAVSFLANLAQALLLVPVLLGAWGAERYGLWVALSSLLTLLTTLDSGHNTFVGNELLRSWPTDRAGARSLFAAGVLGALGLGALELLVTAVLVLGGGLPWALGQAAGSVPGEAALAFVLLVLTWVVQGSLGGIWARLYPAGGRYARAVWWGIAYRLLATVVTIVAVAVGAGILGVVLATSLMTLAYVAALLRDVRARFAGMEPFGVGGRPGLALGNLARSLVVTGSALVVQLQQHGVVFLLSAGVGLSLLPVFTTTRTLANVFFQASAVVTGPLQPEMVRLRALGEHDKLADTLRALWFVSGIPVNLGLCIGLPMYAPLYRAWTGAAMAFDAELFAWLAVAISLRALGAPFTALIAGLNALRAQVWIAVGQTSLVLAVLALGIGPLGMPAAGLAVALGELCGSVILPAVLMRRIAPELTTRLPLGALVVRMLPSAVVAAGLLGAARGWSSPSLAVVASLTASSLLYAAQWRALGAPLRERLLGILRRARV